MTFNEVMRFKQVFQSDKITFDGLEFNILIVPGHRDDFQKYCNNYVGSSFSDESALAYCSDQNFQLMAMHPSKGTVLYKKIG